jgi:WD40 repeat protein/serine/threonine protein kinase
MAEWNPRTNDLFLRAAEVESPSERRLFLDRACGGDAGLRAQVESLLAASEKAGSFLDEPAARALPESPGTVAYEPVAERPGTVIGPYKLLQQIGEGGMGAVFMADQTSPVQRRVALKIIKPGMDSRQVIARFEAERQALAMMDHQNIARVLDAGTTAGGRPYFVMELVHGVPITQFCDDRKLTPRQRLELFVPVCQAIQHAHQKGIIHRDVKPSNVLVTMYDDKPVPKVIDFGVAKAVEQRLTEKTMFTQFGALVGTFEYMSPEQAEMNAFGVDTRSDIYSLGVLLYELLTGTTPLHRQRLREAAFDEMVRLIKEEEAPRPSARLSSSNSLPKIAAARNTEPAQLSRLLRGEIDWIVMKCLEKDRSRRYESASGLARDIQRHLADEPVEACPPGAGYRLRKLAHKYRTPLRVAGAFMLLLVLGAIASTWQAVRATLAESAARASEEVAQGRKREADEARGQAEKRRDELASLNETRRRAGYVSDMNLARVAWGENNLARGRELLDRYRPRPGEKDLRGFEWHYLHHLLHGNELVVRAHGGWVTAVAFTADGKRLVSAATSQPPSGMAFFKGVTGEVKQWDAGTGQPLPFRHHGFTDAVARMTLFGPRAERMALGQHGMHLAASCRDRAIRVWDLATGGSVTLEGSPKHTAIALNFSADGKRLVSVHYPDDFPRDAPGVINIWDLATRKADVTVHNVRGVSRGPSFSSDGKYLAAAMTNQGVVKVWDALTGAEAYSCKYADGRVNAPTFSPDGKRLAACGENGVQVWDTATHQPVATWRSGSNYGIGMAISPDGKRLATGSIEGIVELWHTGTGQMLRTFKGHAGNVERLAFSPDGTRLATGGADGTLRVWDSTERRDALSLPKAGFTLEFPDLSPDGQTVVTRVTLGGKDVRLWDAATGEPRGGRIDLPEKEVSRAWTADGKRLYMADMGKNVTAVDAATGKVVRTFRVDGEAKYIRIALSPDEKWCAYSSGPEGKRAKVRGIQTGAEFRAFHGLDDSVQYLVFTPDGSRLLGADVGGVLKIWEVATGREVAATKFRGIYICGITFSADGKRLAVVGNLSRLLTGEVRVLDAEGFREVWYLKGHTLNVIDAAFSPDGQRLATSSADRTVRVWDLTAGQEILKLSGFAGVVSLRFVEGGRRLMSVSWDRTIRVWDATPLPEEHLREGEAGKPADGSSAVHAQPRP